METMTAVPPRLRWALVAGFSILALLASSQQAHARSNWPGVFIDKYSPGPTVEAAASNCSLCHTQVPTRNPYGMTIEPANDDTIDDRLTLAEPVNSDDDTDGSGNACSNITEINADTLPGDAGSTPANCASAENLPPVADANGPYSGTAGVTVINFDGTGSSDPDGTIVSYDWDFGDGNTGTGENPTHTYAAAATYDVSLTVTDDGTPALSDTATSTATIVATLEDPVADPNGPYDGIAGQPVTFDGSGSFDPDGGEITQYDWDFGDGNTGTGVSPTNTYTTADTYTVTLMVVDDEGDSSATATTSATISETPVCVTTLEITTAEWRAKNNQLRVKGVNTQKCGPVTVTNADDLTQVLGTTNGNGPKFNVNAKDPMPVPCTVQVEQDGVTVQADVANAPADCGLTPQQCIALGGLAYDSWHKSDAGGSGLPPDESDADYTRCKACHGWDQQGTDGGYVRRSRNAGRANAGYQDPNNCDLPGANPDTCTPSRNISTDPTFGRGSPIEIPAGGRSWAEGSAVFDMVDPSWGPGAILGNRHPDLTAPGGPTAQQLACLTAFLNAPEARADQVFAAMDTSANPVIYTPVATADAAAGEIYYADNCSGCHGAPDADSTEASDFKPGDGGIIGYLNQDGKYSEFMHKMHWGAPNTSMTREAMGDPTAADVADVVAYMQTLQAAP